MYVKKGRPTVERVAVRCETCGKELPELKPWRRTTLAIVSGGLLTGTKASRRTKLRRCG